MGCAIFTIVLFLLLTAMPVPIYNNSTMEGLPLVIQAKVTAVHIRNDKLHIYLKNVVCSDDDFTNDKLNTQSVSNEAGFVRKARGAIAYVPFETEDMIPHIGAQLIISGTYKGLETARNPGQFDMARYYQIKGIDFTISGGKILSESESYNLLSDSLYRLRRKLENGLDNSLSEDDSAILKAMILGDKDYLDDEQKDLFDKAGISHLLVVSGTHVGILGVFILGLMRRISGSARLSAVLAGAFILAYGMLTGLGTATFRAVIMYLLCILAMLTGRAYDLLTAISVSAVISLTINPLTIYDSGFLLSYGAVMGLSVVLPVIHDMCRSKTGLTSSLLAGISIFLFTLPITLWQYSRITLYSILLNLILIPLASLLICLGGLIIGSFGLINGLSGACHLILMVYIKLCQLVVGLPENIFITGKPSMIKIAIYYFLLFALVILSEKISNIRFFKMARVLVIFVLVSFITINTHKGFDMTMLDVGQGLCMIVRNDDSCILYDGGSSDEKDVAKYTVIPALRALGIRSIDLVVVSHTDEDHISAIRDLVSYGKMEGIKIKGIAMSHNSEKSDAGECLLKLAKINGIRTMQIKAGDVIKMGDTADCPVIRCIFPDAKDAGDSNEYSVCLRLTKGQFSALLCGDVEGVGEKRLVNMGKELRSVTVFQVAHHGSGRTNSESLIELLKPAVALVSAGRGNSYGHPAKECMDRLFRVKSKTLVTMDTGAITISSDGKDVKLKTFKNIRQNEKGGHCK